MKEKLRKELSNALSVQEAQELKQSILEDIEFVTPLPKEEKQKRNSFALSFKLVSTALACAMCIMLIFPFMNTSTKATVAIDVNPAIELEIDKKERVDCVITRTAEGEKVVGDMDLIDVDIKVAVNALLGRMFQLGYIDDVHNSILLTVKSDDASYRSTLKTDLLHDIELSYQSHSIPVAVLSQELTYESDYEKMAQKHNISAGKVALIHTLLDSCPQHTFEDFVGISIHDLNTLLSAKKIESDSISSVGSESHASYLEVQDLQRIISKHMSVDISMFEYELHCDDGRLVYEVEFIYHGMEYEYEINAISGVIIDYKVED